MAWVCALPLKPSVCTRSGSEITARLLLGALHPGIRERLATAAQPGASTRLGVICWGPLLSRAREMPSGALAGKVRKSWYS